MEYYRLLEEVGADGGLTFVAEGFVLSERIFLAAFMAFLHDEPAHADTACRSSLLHVVLLVFADPERNLFLRLFLGRREA